MAEKFYTILTNIGLAKIANSQVTGNKVNLVEMAVGDGNGAYYNPTSNDGALRNEKWRGPIGSVEIDEDNANWIVIETVIPSEIGGFFLREVGLFDEEGDLIAIGKYPETYKPILDEGSAKDLYIRMIIEVSNASSVTLKVDPTIIIASRKYVDEKIALAVGPINQSLQDLQRLIDEYQRDLAAHLAEDATDAHLAKNIGLEDAEGNFIATELEGALSELFTFANDGKNAIAGVIGEPATTGDDFEELANHIINGKKVISDSLNSKGANTNANDALMELAKSINALSNIPAAGTGGVKSYYSNYHYSYEGGLIKKFNNAGVLLASYTATKAPGGITDYGYGAQVSGERYWDGSSYETPGDLYLYHLNGSLRKYISRFTEYSSWDHRNIYVIGDIWFAQYYSGSTIYDVKIFNINGSQLGTINNYAYISFYNGEKNDLIVRRYSDASDRHSYYNVANAAMRALTTEEQERKNELQRTANLLRYIY